MNSRRVDVGERIQGGAVIISVSGDPAARSEVAPLRRKIRNLLNNGARTVVVDLSDTKFVGAALLGELVTALKTVRGAGGELKLSGVSRRIDGILRTTRLSGVFRKAEPGTAGPERVSESQWKLVSESA